jgi:hypothetical protein
MSQQTSNIDVTQVKNGKITNDDSVSKRGVAAIFPNQEAADAAVGALTEAGFIHTEIEFTPEQISAKGDYLVVVNAGERAIIALEILTRAGGSTNTGQPESKDDFADNVVIALEVLPDGKIQL